MKIKQMLWPSFAILLFVAPIFTTSCSSDNIIYEHIHFNTPKENFRSVDIFKDSAIIANSNDSTINNRQIKSRSEDLKHVYMKVEGPDPDGSYLCTIGYENIILKYLSIPDTYYPPRFIEDDNGHQLVWINFNHSGMGSLKDIVTEYHYKGKQGNSVTVAAVVNYTIDYGVTHSRKTESLEITTTGGKDAAVRYIKTDKKRANKNTDGEMENKEMENKE